jgi:hypothetical protein
MLQTRLSYPQKAVIDRTTPMSCLKSLGLLEPKRATSDEIAAMLSKAHDISTCVKVWKNAGGVSATFLCDRIDVGDREVSGPSDLADFEKSPITFCRVREAEGPHRNAICLFSVSRSNKIADICLYDPTGDAPEECLYRMAGGVGSWLREALGEGWGIRTEVFHERYSPSEIPNMSRFWLMLMIAVKAYMPHVRMIDTQAAMRLECMQKGTTLKEAAETILANVSALPDATQ